jgi:ADP-ribosylglycohydrolase
MVGALIGDVAGSFREFSKNKYPELPLIPTREELPEQIRGNLGITDDTITTIATYLACKDGGEVEDFRRNYWRIGNEFPLPGYGKGFREWLATPYGEALPYNSCGNGSAMRVSPVAYFSGSIVSCQIRAKNSALPTHNHPEGINGAIFVALMVYLYKVGVPHPEEFIKDHFGISYGRSSGYDHFDKTCQETIPLALRILDEVDSFEGAVHRAVCLPNADSDTLGAIVGSIAAERFPIPQELIDQALFHVPEKYKYVFTDPLD